MGPNVGTLVAVSVGNTNVGTGFAPRLQARLAKTKMVKAKSTFFIRFFLSVNELGYAVSLSYCLSLSGGVFGNIWSIIAAMNERSVFPQEVGPKSSLDVYLQILGKKELPKSVEDMPDVLTLPCEAVGGLVDSIQATERDGIERAQSIFWSGGRQMYDYSRVFVGTDRRTGELHAHYLAAVTFFAKKPLLLWHTHPEGIWYFSRQDVSAFRAFHRQGHIMLVGSGDGICAITQTEKSAKTPLSSARVYDRTKKFLTEGKFIEKDAYEMSKIVGELGLKYYFYFPKGGITEKIKNEANLSFWGYPAGD